MEPDIFSRHAGPFSRTIGASSSDACISSTHNTVQGFAAKVVANSRCAAPDSRNSGRASARMDRRRPAADERPAGRSILPRAPRPGSRQQIHAMLANTATGRVGVEVAVDEFRGYARGKPVKLHVGKLPGPVDRGGIFRIADCPLGEARIDAYSKVGCGEGRASFGQRHGRGSATLSSASARNISVIVWSLGVTTVRTLYPFMSLRISSTRRTLTVSHRGGLPGQQAAESRLHRRIEVVRRLIANLNFDRTVMDELQLFDTGRFEFCQLVELHGYDATIPGAPAANPNLPVDGEQRIGRRPALPSVA